MDDINDMPEFIKTKEQFIDFLECLLSNHRERPEDWENISIDSYLVAMIGFARDADGYYFNQKINIDSMKPSWQLFADILLAGRIYE